MLDSSYVFRDLRGAKLLWAGGFLLRPFSSSMPHLKAVTRRVEASQVGEPLDKNLKLNIEVLVY